MLIALLSQPICTINIKFKMKITKSLLLILLLALSNTAQINAEEKAFEFTPGEDDAAESSILGIGFEPQIYLNLSGLLDSDTPVSDLSTGEHDPSRDYQIHPIELVSFFDFSDQLRGKYMLLFCKEWMKTGSKPLSRLRSLMTLMIH